VQPAQTQFFDERVDQRLGDLAGAASCQDGRRPLRVSA
jgi:hypothetical protein